MHQPYIYRSKRVRRRADPSCCPTCGQKIVARPAGEILLDSREVTVHRGLMSAKLTLTTFAAFRALLDAWPHAVSFEQVSHAIYGYNPPKHATAEAESPYNLIHIKVSTIRKRLAKLGIIINTSERGSGSYTIEIEPWPDGKPQLVAVS